MPNLLVIFTSRKITKATIMNRINATRKSPTRAHVALAKRMLRNYGKRRRKMKKPSQGRTQKKMGSLSYSMPHRLLIFTSMKITKATIMNVITATKKLPIPKSWLETVIV